MAQTEAQVKALIVAKLNVIPVALPPGVYKISIGTNRLLTDPDDDKKTLTVGGAADGDNQKVGCTLRSMGFLTVGPDIIYTYSGWFLQTALSDRCTTCVGLRILVV